MSYYFLNHDKTLTKEQIGGKGYYLHQMKQDDLPIPEASFISTELWQEYRKDKKKTLEKLKKQVIPDIVSYFKEHNNGEMPLVSVRSAGAVSMPGMMDTILNVGVNQKYFKDMLAAPLGTGKGKKQKSGVDESFIADNYARFLTMYGDTVLGMKKEIFPRHEKFKKVSDVEAHFEALYEKHKQKMPSQKVEEQLLSCVLAVFDSWDNDRAKLYRKLNNIDENAGTAVVIQQMVFGNKNDQSATGVLFSRNPSNGVAQMTGEFLIKAQGEDVVSGSHTPLNLEELRDHNEQAYDTLLEISERLEKKYKQIQDIEFTIEDGKVYILQARTAKCSPFAKLKMLMDMKKGGEISRQDVLDGFTKQEFLELNVKQVDIPNAPSPDGTGLPASMGALKGRVVFGPSEKYKGEPTIFVAKETTPDDLEAIQMATGVLTASGGVTSHAAVVARGMGKICIVGCSDIKMSKDGQSGTINGKKIESGDWLTMDATTGQVWLGKDIPILDAQNSQIFWDLEALVMQANPQWTRMTSNVDDLETGSQRYYLTYPLDDADDELLRNELKDATTYLTGIMDLTGKLDYLQNKYEGKFMFADVAAEKVFLRKKEVLRDIAYSEYDAQFDFEVYLGPYEEDHAASFRQMGYKVKDSSEIGFEMEGKKALSKEKILTQRVDKSIPDEKVVISSKNALLGVLR